MDKLVQLNIIVQIVNVFGIFYTILLHKLGDIWLKNLVTLLTMAFTRSLTKGVPVRILPGPVFWQDDDQISGFGVFVEGNRHGRVLPLVQVGQLRGRRHHRQPDRLLGHRGDLKTESRSVL